MALIKCPECKKDVSDQASSCVFCGRPLKRKNRMSGFALFGFAISVTSVVLFLIGFLGIIGFTLSLIGLVICKKKGRSGTGLAIAGMIIGFISTAFFAVWSYYLNSLFGNITW